MITLHDIGNEVVDIRKVTNLLQISGKENAAYIVYICEMCDKIISQLNQAVEEFQNESREGDVNGKPD